MSPVEAIAAAVVMAAGAAVQGSVGFGMNVLAAPILIQIDTDLVPGPLLAAALVMSLLVARRDRAGINRSALLWAVCGRVPGAALGTLLLLALSPWGCRCWWRRSSWWARHCRHRESGSLAAVPSLLLGASCRVWRGRPPASADRRWP